MEQCHLDCPLCQINYQKRIHEDEHVVAVIDSYKGDYKERYLIIHRSHCPLEELSHEEWDYMIEAAHALGRARIWQTKEKYEVEEEQDNFSHASIKVGFK